MFVLKKKFDASKSSCSCTGYWHWCVCVCMGAPPSVNSVCSWCGLRAAAEVTSSDNPQLVAYSATGDPAVVPASPEDSGEAVEARVKSEPNSCECTDECVCDNMKDVNSVCVCDAASVNNDGVCKNCGRHAATSTSLPQNSNTVQC